MSALGQKRTFNLAGTRKKLPAFNACLSRITAAQERCVTVC